MWRTISQSELKERKFSPKRIGRLWKDKNAVVYLAVIETQCPPKRGARQGEVKIVLFVCGWDHY